MSIAQNIALPSSCRKEGLGLPDLTFPSIRLAVARVLVVFCFVWPFFNYRLFDPDGTVEINFLPVFLAALMLPEVTLREKWSLLLLLPVFAVATLWASPSTPIRLAIGIIPLHFLLNLTRHLRTRGQELIPPNLAYRVLQIFVCFCLMQTVEFRFFHVIPTWLTTTLTTILPRYSGVPYDEFGIRGVQGWASEPSGAAVTCAAFALVAIYERPGRRWRILALFALLTLLNMSIYALVLLCMLGIGCLATLPRKRYAFLAALPMSLTAFLILARSNRLAELHTNILVDGMNSESNRELARFIQIFSPLQQFPQIYKPPTLFGTIVMEPMGLLPLMAGYGSVFGLIWLAYILRRNYPPRDVPLRPLALVAGFILFMMTAPDLIPAVVAFAVFMVPQSQQVITNRATLKGKIMPIVSIITPVYNAARWLPETLATVRAQTLTDWEQILVDDGSTDGSVEIVEAAAREDTRFRLLRTPCNGGPSTARNLAIDAARGRFIAFLDADDLWLPNKLANSVEWMTAYGYSFIYHDYRHISQDGSRVGALINAPETLDLRTLHTRRGTGGCLSVVIDHVQIPVFHFPPVAPYRAEDFCLWVSIIQDGHIGHRLPADLGRYRLSAKSRSSNKLGGALNAWRIYRKFSRLPVAQAMFWWIQYAWNTSRLYYYARPR